MDDTEVLKAHLYPPVYDENREDTYLFYSYLRWLQAYPTTSTQQQQQQQLRHL
jgi:hypothetical protein